MYICIYMFICFSRDATAPPWWTPTGYIYIYVYIYIYIYIFIWIYQHVYIYIYIYIYIFISSFIYPSITNLRHLLIGTHGRPPSGRQHARARRNGIHVQPREAKRVIRVNPQQIIRHFVYFNPSLFCEFSNLEYTSIYVLYWVAQVENGIRIFLDAP